MEQCCLANGTCQISGRCQNKHLGSLDPSALRSWDGSRAATVLTVTDNHNFQVRRRLESVGCHDRIAAAIARVLRREGRRSKGAESQALREAREALPQALPQPRDCVEEA